MNEYNEYSVRLKMMISAVFAGFTACFGWVGWLVLLYIGCMVGDWLTGSAAACKIGMWKSSVAREGLWHKGGSIIAIGVSAAADALLGLVVNHIPGVTLPFSYGVLIFPVVLVWYILTELGSIIENAEKLGAPIPEFLRKMIAVCKHTVDEAGNQTVQSASQSTPHDIRENSERKR